MKHKTYNDGILYNGNCLKVMPKLIQQGIKVDAIICDIPYGTTACSWDSIIPFDQMWNNLNQLVKTENSPIILFGQQPFTSLLIASNVKNFKFMWYYKKLIASNFATAKYQPMKHIEDVCVFTKSGKVANYYPIMQKRCDSGKNRIKMGYKTNSQTNNETMNNLKRNVTEQDYNLDLKYPENIQEFNNRASGDRGLHPTQKPIALMEYLIKSHTKENDTILDFTCGSGSTLVACRNTKRKFIGIEMNEKYYKICKQRLKV